VREIGWYGASDPAQCELLAPADRLVNVLQRRALN
jgi:hypothetical protein